MRCEGRMGMKRSGGWMRDLAFHYETMRAAYPDENLVIVMDIDGTIIDERHLARSILQAYDREHGTRYSTNLSPGGMVFSPDNTCGILKGFPLTPDVRDEIAGWCMDGFWSSASVPGSHRPLPGVLDVIRWFQLQPRTAVGLNSARPERLRRETLQVLNALGEEYHVRFEDDLVCMNTGIGVPQGKIDGIRRLQARGYRVVTIIDSDRDNLDAMARIDAKGEILFLHADGMPGSLPLREERKSLLGKYYDLTELITRKRLPRHIEFAWHGVDDEDILRQFLISSVSWAELHVRRHAGGTDLVLRRRPYAQVPPRQGENPARLGDFLDILNDAGRGVKLDLKDPGLTGSALDLLKAVGFTDDRVWITVGMEEVVRGALKPVLDAFPGSVRQCPVDGLSPMLNNAPGEAQRYLGMLSRRGIDRFSVNWRTPGSRRMIVRLQNWGYEVNIYDVPDLEAFLQAALLMPRSLTSYFNFPKWFYTGRSDGGERRVRESAVHPMS